MVHSCWLVLTELLLQALWTSRGPDGGLRVAPSHGSETTGRTWLITHYVSHCGGQAGRALAAELGSFERTGNPITFLFGGLSHLSRAPSPQRAKASVRNGGGPNTRHITRWTRHTRGPDHSSCELRCGDVNFCMPRLAPIAKGAARFTGSLGHHHGQRQV